MSLEIDLSGRVALVTGGSRGLGRADALTAGAGADVVVADILVESDESAATGRAAAQAAAARGLVMTEATAEQIRSSAAGRSPSSAT